DFDHGLNTAINKVREVLGDSASNPRFVQTLARRGYRFIAPVTKSADLGPSSVSGEAGVSETPPGPIHPELQVPIPRRAVTRGLFGVIQLMYLIFYVVALLRLHAIQAIADSFLPAWGATAVAACILLTAGVGIPLRCYLISAVSFDYQRLGEKFRRIFPFLL